MARLKVGAEFEPGRLERLDNSARIRHARGQRLLAEHVLPGPRGRDGVLGVQRVGGGDIDDVDLAVAQQVRVVGVRSARPVLLRERLGAAAVAADDGDQRPFRAEGVDRGRRGAAGKAAGPDNSPSQWHLTPPGPPAVSRSLPFDGYRSPPRLCPRTPSRTIVKSEPTPTA